MRISSHLTKKSLLENVIYCEVSVFVFKQYQHLDLLSPLSKNRSVIKGKAMQIM